MTGDAGTRQAAGRGESHTGVLSAVATAALLLPFFAAAAMARTTLPAEGLPPCSQTETDPVSSRDSSTTPHISRLCGPLKWHNFPSPYRLDLTILLGLCVADCAKRQDEPEGMRSQQCHHPADLQYLRGQARCNVCIAEPLVCGTQEV